MNADELKGQWKQLKGKAKEKWGEITDDELDQIEGRRDQLVGKIQERYGKSKEEAEREVDSLSQAEWLNLNFTGSWRALRGSALQRFNKADNADCSCPYSRYGKWNVANQDQCERYADAGEHQPNPKHADHGTVMALPERRGITAFCICDHDGDDPKYERKYPG